MQRLPLRPKIGLLGLTLELYETLAPDVRQQREKWVRGHVLPALEKSADVLFDGAVFSREGIEASLSRFEAAGADAVLVLLLTYSPSQLALFPLKSQQLPIVIWNTQELFAVDEHFSMEALFANHGVHGTQDLANVMVRSGVKFHYVTSHLHDADALDELADFFAAAAALHRLRSARFGLLGYPFPGMGDFAVDTTRLVGSLGCSWAVLTVEDYIKRAEFDGEVEVSDLVAEYRRLYEVAGDVTKADLAATARAELALRGMIAGQRLDGLTYQFLAFGDDERSPTLPFVAVSRLMAEGIGFGGEGDLVAAAATTLFNWLQPPASFTEIFTTDFGGNSVFMSHMGEANVAMARRDRRTPLVVRPTPITRTRERQMCLVTSFEPGPATLMALAQGPNGWRLIATTGTIERFGPLASMYVPHFKLCLSGDVRQFLSDYAQAGGPHHNAVCFGDARRRLRLLAQLMGAEYYEI